MLNHKTKLFLSVAILLAGCTTTLTSKKLAPGTGPDSVGSTYYLPQQTIRVAVTYELRSCEGKADVTKTASITTTNGVDGSAKFHVPANTLSSGNKTTSLTVATFDDGTLRSLGATVDDRTSEIVGGVVGSAGSIARIATGVAFNDGTSVNCSTDLNDIVAKRETLVKNLRDSNMFKGEGERAGAIEALNRLNAATRITRNISFTPNPNASAVDRVSRVANTSMSTERALTNWLDGTNAKSRDNYIKQLLGTTICIRPGQDGGAKVTANPMCGNDQLLIQDDVGNLPSSGLVYRDQKYVEVVVCNLTCGQNGSGIVGRQQVALAQFGPWRTIELTSKPFQDKNVMASWTSAGRLTSLTIGSSSSLEALANSLNTSATSIRETAGAIVTTDQEAINAEIALIRSQADLIEQQNRLEGLQNTTTDLTDN